MKDLSDLLDMKPEDIEGGEVFTSDDAGIKAIYTRIDAIRKLRKEEKDVKEKKEDGTEKKEVKEFKTFMDEVDEEYRKKKE